MGATTSSIVISESSKPMLYNIDYRNTYPDQLQHENSLANIFVSSGGGSRSRGGGALAADWVSLSGSFPGSDTSNCCWSPFFSTFNFNSSIPVPPRAIDIRNAVAPVPPLCTASNSADLLGSFSKVQPECSCDTFSCKGDVSIDTKLGNRWTRHEFLPSNAFPLRKADEPCLPRNLPFPL